MKRTDLSNIMRRAWALFRTTGKTFSVCLSKAWSLYRLTRRMRAGVVRFAYEKADGTLRRACGTLQDIAATIKGTGRRMMVARSSITTSRLPVGGRSKWKTL